MQNQLSNKVTSNDIIISKDSVKGDFAIFTCYTNILQQLDSIWRKILERF